MYSINTSQNTYILKKINKLQCDKCGLTNETRRVQCATLNGKVYPDELCKNKKPEILRECKTNGDTKCDVEWYASQWSDVSVNLY